MDWGLGITYSWAYNPIYNPSNRTSVGYPKYKYGN